MAYFKYNNETSLPLHLDKEVTERISSDPYFRERFTTELEKLLQRNHVQLSLDVNSLNGQVAIVIDVGNIDMAVDTVLFQLAYGG